jgi:hypothetical protein
MMFGNNFTTANGNTPLNTFSNGYTERVKYSPLLFMKSSKGEYIEMVYSVVTDSYMGVFDRRYIFTFS